jgi:general secretion pathway protein B
MSLILEALRKSEAERRRGQAPDIHRDLPLATASARTGPPTWLWWLGPAAVASALLLVAWRWWPARAPAVPVHAGIASSQAQVARTAVPVVTRLWPAGQAPSRPASRAASAVSAAGSAASTPASVANSTPLAASRLPSSGLAGGRAMPAPAAAPPASTTSPGSAEAPAATAPATRVDDTVALSDLSVGERKALPPLKLSMHLWNTDPAKRFVIVDGNRLREGDRAGDAVVTSITEDGVVLDWNGRRIRLSIR